MGKRGPTPGSGGRPKKALADKVLEGNPGKRSLKIIELPTFEGAEMPEPKFVDVAAKRFYHNYPDEPILRNGERIDPIVVFENPDN